MRTKAALIAGAFAALTAAQAQAQDDKNTEKVCQDVAALRVAWENFEGLDQDATVKEADEASDQVGDAIKSLKKAAEKARPEEYKELKEAHKAVQKAIDDAPDDATLAQTQASIDTARANERAAYRNLTNSIECP